MLFRSLRVDDGGCFGSETGEVLTDRHAANVGIGRQERLQGDGGRDLAHPDQGARGLVDGLVQRLEEMLRLEEIRDAIERVVVDQDRTQEALFRFDVVRRTPVGRGRGIGRELVDVRINQGHGRAYSSDFVVTDSLPF